MVNARLGAVSVALLAFLGAETKRLVDTRVVSTQLGREGQGEQGEGAKTTWLRRRKDSEAKESNALGVVHDTYVQKFKVTEKKRLSFERGWSTEHNFALVRYYDARTGATVKKNINVPVMNAVSHFLTMRGRVAVTVGQEEYWIMKSSMINLRYSWRVTRKGSEVVLFTIQKRFLNDCKYLQFFKCKSIWKIYRGHKGDESSLIYYGVGDARNQDEPDVKFYHSKSEWQNNEENWAAKVEHKKKRKKIIGDEDEFKVRVRPHEDAALILLSTVCLDQVADDVREDEFKAEVKLAKLFSKRRRLFARVNTARRLAQPLLHKQQQYHN